jgi:bifunctional DNA-binding transcriptional regulator/antitoxin component of YhaV-PrlF toxin-antitoxin module
MTTIKLHYDGWLALPAALRRQLSLETGDLLEVELVDGAIVLRLPGSASMKVKPAVPELPATAIAVTPRKRGRLAKAATPPAVQRLRVGGRRTAKPAASEPSQA